jgi:hypothetical protein
VLTLVTTAVTAWRGDGDGKWDALDGLEGEVSEEEEVPLPRQGLPVLTVCSWCTSGARAHSPYPPPWPCHSFPASLCIECKSTCSHLPHPPPWPVQSFHIHHDCAQNSMSR